MRLAADDAPASRRARACHMTRTQASETQVVVATHCRPFVWRKGDECGAFRDTVRFVAQDAISVGARF